MESTPVSNSGNVPSQPIVTTEYALRSTSRASAVAQDIPLDGDATKSMLTRRIARATLVDNVHDKANSVKVTIMHQRRANAAASWQDADSYNLATMKAGQQIKLDLTSAQTRALHDAITDLYAASNAGVPQGEKTVLIVDGQGNVVLNGRLADVVSSLAEAHGDTFIDALDELRPDFLEALSVRRLHRVRAAATAEFKSHLENGDWDELLWQRFFERNTWILGQGLILQFLQPVNTQPHYGGATVDGTGFQRGDFLMATAAKRRFAVLVDIKQPSSELVKAGLYRNKVHEIGHELVGGVTQLQSNCRTWVLSGSTQEENAELLTAAGISTYEPRGILVIGNTRQLDTKNKRATFELFRRNLHNPDVVTYDELLERAEAFISTAT
jgi:hypothetical protein